MNDIVLAAHQLTKHFRAARGGHLGRRPVVHAVEDVHVELRAGRITAMVGESGCGKSTVARLLARVYPPTSGELLLHGRPAGALRPYRRAVQLVFQDPFASLNPFHRVEYHLARPLRLHGHAHNRRQAREQVAELLDLVSLTPVDQFARKLPHELSGGQRQRVAIARALAARPDVLIADEPVSMLDVSIRLGVLRLLERLARQENLALLYITHDIASARYFADDILVMYAGRIIEHGPAETVTSSPAHPYTQLLISAAPDADTLDEPVDEAGHGEPPSLLAPPPGCRFHPRCPQAKAVCAIDAPAVSTISEAHTTNCWLYPAVPVVAQSPGYLPGEADGSRQGADRRPDLC